MHTCPWWFTWTFDNPLRRLVHDAHKMLEPYVVPGSRVADIGCGMGYFTVELARSVGPAGNVQAVDVQPQQLRVAERRCRRAGVAESGAVHRSDSRVARADRARRFRAGVLDAPRGWRPRRLLQSTACRDRARRPGARGRTDVPRLARAGRGGARAGRGARLLRGDAGRHRPVQLGFRTRAHVENRGRDDSSRPLAAIARSVSKVSTGSSGSVPT